MARGPYIRQVERNHAVWYATVAGLPVGQIAEKMERHPRTVRRVLQQAGIVPVSGRQVRR